MRAHFIYEKFTEDSDPINDMGIGITNDKVIKELVDKLAKKLKKWDENFDPNSDIDYEVNASMYGKNTWSMAPWIGDIDEIIFSTGEWHTNKILKNYGYSKSYREIMKNLGPTWIIIPSGTPNENPIFVEPNELDKIVTVLIKREYLNIDTDIKDAEKELSKLKKIKSIVDKV